jgi:TrmH family RNA methyltransferase
MKTMGFTRLGLVRPSRLALPDNPMAKKMAVKSEEILGACDLFDNLDEALAGIDVVVATTSHRGVSYVTSPVALSLALMKRTRLGQSCAILFGNEKTGLAAADLKKADLLLRIPMVAPQPSVNLAQCVQIVAYQLLQSALVEQERLHESAGATNE